MYQRLKHHLSFLSAAVLGQTCAACNVPCARQPVCHACAVFESLPRCLQCAIPLQSHELCGACIRKPPPYDASVCLGSFEKPLSSLIAQLKFESKLLLAPWFARELTRKLQGVHFDVVIPMPLHAERLKERGFNQSAEIAKHMPFACLFALERIRNTPSQRTVGAGQRFSNVKGAFIANQRLEGLRVLLLDDVVTTTATVQAASSALKAAGAAQVIVACLARVG